MRSLALIRKSKKRNSRLPPASQSCYSELRSVRRSPKRRKSTAGGPGVSLPANENKHNEVWRFVPGKTRGLSSARVKLGPLKCNRRSAHSGNDSQLNTAAPNKSEERHARPRGSRSHTQVRKVVTSPAVSPAVTPAASTDAHPADEHQRDTDSLGAEASESGRGKGSKGSKEGGREQLADLARRQERELRKAVRQERAVRRTWDYASVSSLSSMSSSSSSDSCAYELARVVFARSQSIRRLASMV